MDHWPRVAMYCAPDRVAKFYQETACGNLRRLRERFEEVKRIDDDLFGLDDEKEREELKAQQRELHRTMHHSHSLDFAQQLRYVEFMIERMRRLFWKFHSDGDMAIWLPKRNELMGELRLQQSVESEVEFEVIE